MQGCFLFQDPNQPDAGWKRCGSNSSSRILIEDIKKITHPRSTGVWFIKFNGMKLLP